MPKKSASTRAATEILDRRHPPSQRELLERDAIRQDLEIAEMIHQVRTSAGLTQRQLAKRVGTTASVISRLEDAEYEGHSMTMLRRIAAALGLRVEVRFVSNKLPKRVA